MQTKDPEPSTRISMELVPRDEESLQEELDLVKNTFPKVDTLNIPDLPRFKVRSWRGCELARGQFGSTIPHIRAVDCDPDKPLAMAETLVANHINEVLVVTGDVEPGSIPRSNALEIIRKFKRELPGVKVYGALDPYRSGFKEELDYLKRKREMGADGFFTQPFFDIRLLEIYQEALEGSDVFWGVSPVTTENSQKYWESRNKVVFPKSFVPNLEWNRKFAAQALQFVRERGAHIYFMPIRVNIERYLGGILE
ncbi:MAG: methylenetetrahydrofolate reductase [Magnetococcales bacterium]|nr:methylenetetrahydrofolate reductase [Magnetococcales bacterium]